MPGCLPATAAPKSVYLSIYLSISICLSISIYLSICLSLSIHLSNFISFFLSFFLSLWQLFSFIFFAFAFPCVCFAEKKPNKEASKQASKQASTSCSPLDLLCCWGGRCPPPNPTRATKSALHLRHPRLPRNQYFKVNSPVQKFPSKNASCASSLSLCCFFANCTKLL